MTYCFCGDPQTKAICQLEKTLRVRVLVPDGPEKDSENHQANDLKSTRQVQSDGPKSKFLPESFRLGHESCYKVEPGRNEAEQEEAEAPDNLLKTILDVSFTSVRHCVSPPVRIPTI